MKRVIKYLATEPSLMDILDRVAALEASFTREKTISAQIDNQDERQMLEAIATWAGRAKLPK